MNEMKIKILFVSILLSIALTENITYSQVKEIKEKELWGNYISEKFEKAVKVNTGVYIFIDHKFGKIEVNSWQKNEVLIKGEKKVYSEVKKSGEKFIKDIFVDISKRGNNLLISTEYPSFRTSDVKSYQVNYIITVPGKCNLRIENSFGNITVLGVEGDLDVTTGHSIINVKNIGGEVSLTNKFGAVNVQGVRGNAEVETTNGDINISDISGDFRGINKFGLIEVSRIGGNADVRNSNGRIKLENISGIVEARNSFGKISVIKGDSDLRVFSSNGDIEIESINGRVEITGSFGKIRVKNCNSSLRIDSKNSSIQVNEIKKDVDINNSFGSIIAGNIYGNLKIDNSNDAISVWCVKGETIIRNKFGRVEANDIENSIFIENSNSPVSVKNVSGSVDVENSFSLVEIIGAKNDVKINNRNGNVELSGIEPLIQKSGRRIRISTTNGVIKVFLPFNISGTITAKTTFGEIYSDFLLEKDKYGSTIFAKGRLGKEGVDINLETKNSTIYIRKEQ